MFSKSVLIISERRAARPTRRTSAWLEKTLESSVGKLKALTQSGLAALGLYELLQLDNGLFQRATLGRCNALAVQLFLQMHELLGGKEDTLVR